MGLLTVWEAETRKVLFLKKARVLSDTDEGTRRSSVCQQEERYYTVEEEADIPKCVRGK